MKLLAQQLCCLPEADSDDLVGPPRQLVPVIIQVSSCALQADVAWVRAGALQADIPDD
jgi:hypothetical protein